MSKHKIILNIGSTVQWNGTDPVHIIKTIDYKNKVVEYEDGSHQPFRFFNLMAYAYNGVDISNIESVEITQPKNFSHIKPGQFLKKLNSEEAVKIITASKNTIMYSILLSDNKFGGRFLSCFPQAWDLIDVIDNDPTQQNKPITGDKLMHGEDITKDNIAGVLLFNGIKLSPDYSLYIDDNFIKINGKKEQASVLSVHFMNPKWLEILEAYFGKLKPLPKFNFKQYLRDNSFYRETAPNQLCNGNGGIIIIIDEERDEFKFYNIVGQTYKCDKMNADILIGMNSLSGDLK